MEILLKAKQGDNPQFSFLNQGDPLNKYYKHVLNAFKNSRYKGQDANKIGKCGNVLKLHQNTDWTGKLFIDV